MEIWGRAQLGVIATIAFCAFAPTTASALAPINVNDSETDAPLKSSPTGCESTDTKAGCTLRAAIEEADEEGGPVTINVPAGTYTNTLGELEVEGDTEVTIDGAGAGQTIIDGGGVSSVFYVESDSSLTVNGVTIQGGEEEDGGGVFVRFGGTLTVEKSDVEHNAAEGEDDGLGGGIFGEEGATIIVKESSVANNYAERAGGGIYEGLDFVQIETAASPQFCEDARRATRTNKKVHPAIVDDGGGGVTIEHSTVSDNEAEVGDGGGVLVTEEDDCGVKTTSAKPAAIEFDGDSLLVNQSTIADNTSGEEGGGIYDEVFETQVYNSTISGNFAEEEGGALYAEDGTFAVLVSDTVYDNTVDAETIPTDAGKTVKPDTEEPDTGNNLATSGEEDEGAILLRNTIVAEPTSEAPNCEGAVFGLEEGENYNLDYPSTPTGGEEDTCGMESTGEDDLVGIQPGFETGELANNGGPTQTIALAASSAAINVVPIANDCQGSSEGPEGVDERGSVRPGIPGDACDVGAYEYQRPVEQPPAPKEEPKPAPVIAPAGQVLPFTVSVPKACTSLRDIRIHIQNVKQFGIVSAVISIDGHSKRTVRGNKLTTAIDLRGLPKGTFTVEITARTRSGHKLTGKRVYHTCHLKLPGHSYLPL